MKRQEIQALVADVLPQILVRYKHAKREMGGWIVGGYLVWLDKLYCDSHAVYIEDDVAVLMNLIGAVSFHTHPINDASGKECISGADKISATAFGHEVVVTSKGVYLLVPYKKQRLENARKLEESLWEMLDKETGLTQDEREDLFNSMVARHFKCHCYKILDI